MITNDSIFLYLVAQAEREFIYAVVSGVVLFMLARVRA